LKVSIAAAQLWWISRTAEPQMSDEGVRKEKLAELHERLELLKRDLNSETALVRL
jgi:hypothetical protein